MGFYLRKTIKVGGINLNLSSSGLGVSTGVRGFRVGMNGRGTYVQMGRGGLYYRKQVSWRRMSQSQAPSGRQQAAHEQPLVDSSIIYTENLAQPLQLGTADASAEQVLAHFRPPQGFLWAWVVGGFGVLAMGSSPNAGGFIVALTLVAVVVALIARQRRVLVYDLEDQALARYERFVNSFGEFFTAKKLWLYERRDVTTDWKRNAGATNLMKRRIAELLPSGDPKIRTNISIPCIKSGNEAFYFLPDMIVARQGANLRSFEYHGFDLATASTRFIEGEGVPTDAQVVDRTWKFVNKRGGPDRRFKDNRQLPVCLYQTVGLSFGGTHERTFSKSRVAEALPLVEAFRSMAEVLSSLRAVTETPALSSSVISDAR